MRKIDTAQADGFEGAPFAPDVTSIGEPQMRRAVALMIAAMAAAVAMAVPAAAAGSEYYAGELPWARTVDKCIGGGQCGGTANTITIRMADTYVATVIVEADDNVGDSHRAALELWVNDTTKVQTLDVKEQGSLLIFKVDRIANTVTLKSVQNEGKPDGEETAVGNVVVLA